MDPSYLSAKIILASPGSLLTFCVFSLGTGDHFMLPREHGGQGAQEDPHTATLHGRLLHKHTGTHTLNVSVLFILCGQTSFTFGIVCTFIERF